MSQLFDATRLFDMTISAVLLAGLYATMAYGLGLIYGVLRVVNLAHGGVIMVGAYLGWILHERAGIDPYVAIPIVAVLTFGLGVGMYVGLVQRLPRGAAGGPASLLLLFGVWLVLRNIAYLMFKGNDQYIHTSYAASSWAVAGTHIAISRLVVLIIAIAIAVGLQWMLHRTQLGRAIRAVAQNPDSCTLVGIDVRRIYMWTFGLGTALSGVAGVLFATIFPFNPASGASELLKSFVVVVLGGLGSMIGIAAAALVVAVAEVFSILVLPAYLTTAVGFFLLVLVLILRPGGLFGQRVLA